MFMTVSGLGDVGLTQAVGMAKMGHKVLGVDPDVELVERLFAGDVPYFEKGFQGEFKKQLLEGRLVLSSTHGEVSREADVHWLCTDVPVSSFNGEPNLNGLLMAVDVLKGFIKDGALVVGRSSVPVGTAHQVFSTLQFRLNGSVSFDVAWQPVLDEVGGVFKGVVKPGRVFVGAETETARETFDKIYGEAGVLPDVVWLDLISVEFLKLADSAYINVRNGFLNALTVTAESKNINSGAVVESLKMLETGRRFTANEGFNETVGGDSDLKALMFDGEKNGEYLLNSFVHTVEETQNAYLLNVFYRVKESLDGNVADKKIVILGCAVKPDVEQCENSVGVRLASLLHNSGAKVLVHDPKSLPKMKTSYPFLKQVKSLTGGKAFNNVDMVVVATPWGQYLNLTPEKISNPAGGGKLFDITGQLGHLKWLTAGWDVKTVGGLNLR